MGRKIKAWRHSVLLRKMEEERREKIWSSFEERNKIVEEHRRKVAEERNGENEEDNSRENEVKGRIVYTGLRKKITPISAENPCKEYKKSYLNSYDARDEGDII